MSAAHDIVRTTAVTRVFGTGQTAVHALRGVDLSVPRGSFAAIKGRSGSGKTTLLNLLGGLDRPTSGEVYFEDRPLSGFTESEMVELRRRRIGFVFQSFALLPIFSAYENVALPLRIAGTDTRSREQRAMQCLEQVGLVDRKEHRPYELSGGQQQRVAIARALANAPSLIIADEPTGELDSSSGRQIMALFQEIAAGGVTVIVATHDPIVTDYATAVHMLRDGTIEEPGTR